MYICNWLVVRIIINFIKSISSMRRICSFILGGLLGLFAFSNASAQVDGVSYTVSPSVSYNWWNQNVALKNSPFYGLRFGFGFGPYVELRGTFEKSINLKNAFEERGWLKEKQDLLDKLEGMDMDVTRVGGELKFNILNSAYAVAPYITLGGGVQILNYNPFDVTTGVVEDAKQKEKQIYLSAGVGVRFNLTERVALSVEGRNLQMQMGDDFLNPTIKDNAKRWGNWGALASLDITLGGTSRYSDKTMKYSNLFDDGFRGMKFVLEPGILYADFHDKVSQADQWFVGGAAGVDFSSLVGIRGFYYQGTEDPQKLNFKFNKDLKMYGGNLIFRLNQPRGILPYLTLGAGYLDDNSVIPMDPDAPKALDEVAERFNTHNLFLMGGAGVEIPFSKYVALFGSVNAMLSSGNEKMLNTVVDDVYTSVAYNAGLRINLGRSAYEPSNNITDGDVNDRVNQMQSEERRSSTRSTIFGKETIREGNNGMMTKREFEDMVDRILNKIRSEENSRASQFSQSEMDIIVSALNAQNAQNGRPAVTTQDLNNQQLVNEMRRLVDRLDRQQTYAPSVAQVAPVQRVAPVAAPAQVVPGTQYGQPTVQPTMVKDQFLKLNRIAPVTGFNFGEGTQWMLGIRGYMQISDTDLDFVPELMFGFGSKNAFDLSGNVVYNIRLNSSVIDPYVGLGLGLYSHGNGLKFGTNVILGTNFKLGTAGELFADYTVRGLFKNNQIAVGYRFVF